MWEPGKRVVIRDEMGRDKEVGVVVESLQEGAKPRVKVRTPHGERVVNHENLVEHLED